MPRKSNISYCQRLIQSLERPPFAKRKRRPRVTFNLQSLEQPEPANRKPPFAERKRPPRVILLDLPAEIRQLILFYVLTDDDISNDDLISYASPLATVCTKFHEDMKSVLPLWHRRKAELEKARLLQRGSRQTEQSSWGSQEESVPEYEIQEKREFKKMEKALSNEREERVEWVWSKWGTQTEAQRNDAAKWHQRVNTRLAEVRRKGNSDEAIVNFIGGYGEA